MRSPRRRFAASFVVTLAASACGRTVDHRGPVTPTSPTTADTSSRDHRDAPTSWTVVAGPDGTCAAQAEGATPVKIACPDGPVGAGLHIMRDGDSCMVMGPEPVCPAGASCNPPPPQKIDCPK